MKSLAFRYWGKRESRWYYNSEDYPLHVFFDDERIDSKHEVQEATGFFDRNGQEIWEGDIVHLNFVEEMRVVWDAEIGAWVHGSVAMTCSATRRLAGQPRSVVASKSWATASPIPRSGPSSTSRPQKKRRNDHVR